MRDVDGGDVAFQGSIAGLVGEAVPAVEGGPQHVCERAVAIECDRAFGRRIDEDCRQRIVFSVRVVLKHPRSGDGERVAVHLISVIDCQRRSVEYARPARFHDHTVGSQVIIAELAVNEVEDDSIRKNLRAGGAVIEELVPVVRRIAWSWAVLVIGVDRLSRREDLRDGCRSARRNVVERVFEEPDRELDIRRGVAR